MSERETCWLVETKSSTGTALWWASMRDSKARVTADRMKANRYTESIAWAIADALHTSTGDDWRPVQHTFDPPKTPGQRLHEAVSHSLESVNYPWVATTSGVRAKWEAAATEFLAGEPKAESVTEAVLREREACVKIAEHPIAAISLPCTNPVSFADGFRKAQELILNCIRARGETWQEYLKQAVDRRQQGLR